MEIQNELKKIAVSEVQINKMREVYSQSPKTNNQPAMNINSIEKIVEEPVNIMPENQPVVQEVSPFANGSTSIFDIPEQPVVEPLAPVVEQQPSIITEAPKVEPNIPQAPETNIFNVEPTPVIEQAPVFQPEPIVQPTQPIVEQQAIQTNNVEINNAVQNIEDKDQEILDKLYDLQLHINQFAIELEEYLSNKKNIKEVNQVLNNVNEQQPVKIEQSIPVTNYDESINIFDAPNGFKL